MGCVYSHDKARNGSNAEGDNTTTNNNNNNLNQTTTTATVATSNANNIINNNNTDRSLMGNGSSRAQRFINNTRRTKCFEVSTMDDDSNEVSTGTLEIAQHEMIFRMHKDPNKAIPFPFKALRKYGKKNDIFSFEMGRRFPSGSGYFCLRCSNATELYDELVAAISQTTTNSLPRPPALPTMAVGGGGGNEQVREYQNMNIQPNGRHGDQEPIMMPVLPNRPESSLANQPSGSHPTYTNLAQYLNLVTNTNTKSMPNYYASSPNAAAGAADETSPTPRIQVSSQDHFAFDATTGQHHLHPMDMEMHANPQHEYVNSNILNNVRSHSVEMELALNNAGRPRKTSEHEHTYENHDFTAAAAKAMRNLEEIKHKINASDDLGTFCMVNIDRNNPRIAVKPSTLLPRSERTTPEPPSQSYIQLDLNNDKHKENNNNSEPNAENGAKKCNAGTGDGGDGGEAKEGRPSTSGGKTSNNENNGANKGSSATVPYAQIDFAKTLALSNSTANHRKL